MFLKCVGTEIRRPMVGIILKLILFLEATPLNPDQPTVMAMVRYERPTVTAALKQDQFVDTRLLVDTAECPYL